MDFIAVFFGSIGFGFAIIAVVLVIITFVKGPRYLSDKTASLQEMHTLFQPNHQNVIEVIENEDKEQDESGDSN